MLKGRQNIFRHTVVARKVVGKSASDNPDRIVDGFEYCSPKKFERTAQEAMDVCSRVLMESNKRRFDSYSRSKQCIDHIPYYYIHTEKYSPKSYVINFCTQISSSQSQERTMVFTREKNDTPNQNRERCFFTCEKNDTSNQKPQRCEFRAKIPAFY